MGTSSASQAMKLLLALALVGVVTAHWTHDDSLAREIGAPPGEEDMDVAALSDELISERESTATKITYRITIGTAWVENTPERDKVAYSWWNGGSSQLLRFSMKGRKGWSGNPSATIMDPGSPQILRYYQGPFMDWTMAGELAPTLLPGLVPLLTPVGALCSGLSGKDTGKLVLKCTDDAMVPQGKSATGEWSWCEPNTKECKSKIKDCKTLSQNSVDCTGVGYARPPPTILMNGVEDDSTQLKMGLIQRGQIEYDDVGEITEVTASSFPVDGCPPSGQTTMTPWDCSSPWYPKFIKVNSNNAKTGIGNGIYYIHPMAGLHTSRTKNCDLATPPVCTISDDMKVLAKPGPIKDTVTPNTMSGDHNAELKKCVAQQCEEEMDSMYGLAEAEAMQSKMKK